MSAGKTAKKARAEYKKAVRSSKPGSGKRSAALAKVLKAEGVRDPGALIGKIGRKKYGKKKMAKWSAKGRKKNAGKKGGSKGGSKKA